MTRLIAATACAILMCVVGSQAADNDPVRKKLDDARATYDKAMRDYSAEVGEWFKKEDEAARKLKAGVTEKVKQVAAEKKEFDASGSLPKRVPILIRDKSSRATDTLVKAYKAASDEYSRQKKDDDAAAVEKELDTFKKGGSVAVSAAADAFKVKSVWVKDNPRQVLTVTERKGEKFTATFVIGDKIERVIAGTIKDGKISWLAKDVRAVRGGVGGDNNGTLGSDKDGDKIDFMWKAENGATGMYTLRFSKDK